MSILSVEKLGVVMQDKVILQDCSFETEAGKFIGIIGPNGSGKTTFLKAVRGSSPIRAAVCTCTGKTLPA